MNEKEYKNALKEREEALLNEPLMGRKPTPEEIEKLKKEGRI